MIEGLRVTMTGEELRRLLDEGVGRHEARADWWRREALRTKEDETEDAPLLPAHMCEYEEERHGWRADVLAFLRDHIETGETYRLADADLEFGELLPVKPGQVEQQDYEEQTRLGFNLERLVKSVDGLVGVGWALRGERARDVGLAFEEEIEQTSPGFRATRIHVEGGPEIIKIERTDLTEQSGTSDE